MPTYDELIVSDYHICWHQMFTQLRFTYEQESHPEEFFIPYVWQLVLSRRLVFIVKHMLFVRVSFSSMCFSKFYIFVFLNVLF